MSFFAPSLGYVARKLKKDGCRVIGILDNVVPHEKHFFDRPLTKYFLNGCNAYVTLCDAVARDLLSIKPDARYMTSPHPLYSHFGEKLPKTEAEDMPLLFSGGHLRPAVQKRNAKRNKFRFLSFRPPDDYHRCGRAERIHRRPGHGNCSGKPRPRFDSFGNHRILHFSGKRYQDEREYFARKRKAVMEDILRQTAGFLQDHITEKTQ